MKKWCTFGLWILLGISSAFAQDTAKVLSYDQFLDIVTQHHPIALQGDILTDMARQELVKARGGFDPKLEGNWLQKEFGGKTYYALGEAGLKIPTWTGIDLKASYEYSSGIRVNEQNYLPAGGLAGFGVSVPLLEGLWIDDRRVALKQAKVMQNLSEVQRQSLLNGLFMDAAQAYWEWSFRQQQVAIYTEAEAFATQQFQFVKASALLGDKPAIDTVEALIQLQNIQIALMEATMQQQNARLNLNNYLWLEGVLPLELEENTLAEEPPTRTDALNDVSNLTQQIQELNNTHPDLVGLQLELKQLELDRKLKVNKLLPMVNINYNVLAGEQFNFQSGESNPLLWNNYKWGLQVSIPIFLGKERGDLNLAKLKIRNTQLKQQLKAYEQQNKALAYLNEVLTLQQQLEVYNSSVINYQTLLDGEVSLFRNGESSQFLVNSRQMKLIEAREKLLKTQTKLQQKLAGLYWSIGTFLGAP